MLIDHADTGRVGVSRAANLKRPAIDFYRAVIGLVITHQAFGKGAFSRPVFAQQGVERTAGKVQTDILQGLDRTEALGHAFDGNVWRRTGFAGGHEIASMNLSEVLTVPKILSGLRMISIAAR